MDATVYAAAGGQPAIRALAYAWHQRCLADPVLNHPFSHDGHPLHTDRLAAYWGEALGGPPLYSIRLGDHTAVLRMHAGNGEHEDMDRRAEAAFAQAMDDAGLPSDPRLRTALQDYFHWAIGQMAGYPDSADDVPAGLSVPQWSWAGPTGSG